MNKMNNKGFTLVEVLAVLVILSVIMSIAIPIVTSSLDIRKGKNSDQVKEKIKVMAELYLSNNNMIINNTNSDCYIDINDLVSKGYIKKNDADGLKYIKYSKSTNSFEFLNDINSLENCVGV